MLLETYKLTLVDIAEVDLQALHTLSLGVRWPHRRDDWSMLVAFGRGVAACDEIGRVVGSAMWFPYSEGFATVGMVIIPPRLQAQGAGRWLMDHVLMSTGGRALGLNSTRAAHALYRSLGFSDERTVYQCHGVAIVPKVECAPPDGILRDIEPADREDIAALDAETFGTRRDDLFRHLFETATGTVLVRGGRVVAFALCRRFGRGAVIGPVVASCDGDAIAVVGPHVLAHAGRFLRLDTREPSGDFAAFLAASGLPVADTVTTMSLRRPWLAGAGHPTADRPETYGLASQALS